MNINEYQWILNLPVNLADGIDGWMYLTEFVDKLVVIGAVDVAGFHEAHVLLADGLLDAGGHFPAE